MSKPMKKSIISIDGSFGEGGGQILRSSLGLAMVTGQPFELNNIRAKRSRPGLLRQHLTAVNAAAEISGASVTGNHIGSDRSVFEPGTVSGGEFTFSVGTAGSTTLVLQAVLPALLTAPEQSTIILEGGTHNPMAPPFHFLKRSFLGVINRMGSRVSASIERYGFYPAGGGRFTVTIEPAERLKRCDIMERGKEVSRRATALYAKIPADIAESERRMAGRMLSIPDAGLSVDEVSSPGPGNVVLIEVESEHVTYVATSFGEKGLSRERVVKRAVKETRKYLEAEVPVCEHLADQLLIPFAMAGGGSFRTVLPSLHTLTNIEVVKKFMDTEIRVEEETEKSRVIRTGDIK